MTTNTDTRNVRIGGVLRCCLATYTETETSDMRPGDRLPCNYCQSGLILADDNVWEWDRQ